MNLVASSAPMSGGTAMITFIRNISVVIGSALSFIGVVDSKPRALITGVTLITAAWALHRRSRTTWWIISGALVFAFGASLLQFSHGPRTPFAFMCSLLGTLIVALIASWWWRLKPHCSDSRLTSK